MDKVSKKKRRGNFSDGDAGKGSESAVVSCEVAKESTEHIVAEIPADGKKERRVKRTAGNSNESDSDIFSEEDEPSGASRAKKGRTAPKGASTEESTEQPARLKRLTEPEHSLLDISQSGVPIEQSPYAKRKRGSAKRADAAAAIVDQEIILMQETEDSNVESRKCRTAPKPKAINTLSDVAIEISAEKSRSSDARKKGKEAYRWKNSAEHLEKMKSNKNTDNENVFIATASEDNTARLWDCVTGDTLCTLEHPSGVKNVFFTPKNTKLITCHANEEGAGYVVVVWDLANQCKTLSISEAVSCPCFTAAVNSLETKLVTASMSVWDIASGELSLSIKGNSTASSSSEAGDLIVRQVCFSSDDSRLVATIPNCKDLIVFDSSNGQQLITLSDHSDQVLHLASCPPSYGGLTFASSDAHTIIVWNHLTYQQVFTVSKPKEFINGICFGSNENLLIASAVYGLNVWDISTGALLLDIYAYSALSMVVYNPVTNTAVVSCPASNRIKLFEVATGDVFKSVFKRHGKFVNAIACSPSTTSSLEAVSTTLLSLSSLSVPVPTSTIHKTHR